MTKQTRKSVPFRHNKCPMGYVKRKGYTRKNTGTKVKTRCIRSTRSSSAAPKNTTQRQKARLATVLGTRKSCPPGQIARTAYVRRVSKNVAAKGYTKTTKSGRTIRVYPKSKSVFVPAACVTDVGKPGKGAPAIGPLRPGELKSYGYSYKLGQEDRRAALKQAVQAYGPLGTYRKLNAVAKLTSRTAPEASQRFTSDRNWIRATYGQGAANQLKAF